MKKQMPIRARNGDLVPTDSLAWLWISWVRKYNLSLEIISEVRQSTTDLKILSQSQIVLDYFGYKSKPKRILS